MDAARKFAIDLGGWSGHIQVGYSIFPQRDSNASKLLNAVETRLVYSINISAATPTMYLQKHVVNYVIH